MKREELKQLKKEKGRYPAYTSIGFYPLFYVDSNNLILCSNCANKEGEYNDPIVDFDVNWEDPNLFCDDCDCSKRIESAYAEED